MKRLKKFLPLLILFVGTGFAKAQTPSVYFLDLLSGPNTGGESNNGTILSIGGNNFGSMQGTSTVTVGGGAVATYKTWSNTKIQVAIGSGAKSGPVVVNVGGTGSACVNHDDGCSFTVRSGNIYYVSPSGSDSAAGSFTAPWATLKHADATVKAGDTVYAMNGFATGSSCDGIGWHANFSVNTSTGTSGSPIAYIAYPGATATIGALSAGSCSGDTTSFSVRTTGSSSYVTLSGLTLRNAVACLEINQGTEWRLINLDCESANASSQYATFQTTGTTYVYAYGNNMHDTGGASKLNSGFYFTSNTDHGWFGWNKVGAGNTTSSAMVEIHSTSGNDQFDWHVHDNFIQNGRGDCLILTTVDPSKGVVEVYNNVFYHCGIGPTTQSSDIYHYDAISMTGELDAGTAPSGTVQIYNNTFDDYGSAGNQGFGATFGAIYLQNQASPSLRYQFTNNIFASTGTSEPYFTSDSVTSVITGCSNNLYYGGGNGPSYCSSNDINSNPAVVSLSTPDLSLQSSSPAIGAGISAHVPIYDYAGLLRPSPPSIGAYEYAASAGSPPAAPVVSLTIN